MGVRLFFVLSGFLITSILLTARSDAETVGASRWRVLGAFYARRSLRIFPLAYLALFIAWLLGDASMQRYPEWYLTYTSNILNAEVGWHGAMGHFWSLAVEEQFYLLWPLLVLFASRAWLVPVLVCAVVSAGLMRGLMAAEDEWIAAYVLLWTRGDALAFGGLLAVKPDLRTPVLAVAGVVLVVVGTVTNGAMHAIVAELGMILLSAAVVLLTTRGRAAAVLSWRPLVMVGTISYGIYVWHQLVPKIVALVEASLDTSLHMPVGDGWERLGYITVATLVLATSSWFLFEKPLNDLRSRVPYVRRRPRVATLAPVRQT